ncbi:MAG: glutathione S-transferase family protein, partial [Pseudomonadota bacterium]
AVWGWATRIPFMLGDEAMAQFPNIKRLVEEIDARPATQRALELPKRHAFKAELDEEAKRHLYPQNYSTAAP